MSLVMFLFGMVTDFHSMGVCGAWPPDFHPWSFLQISVVGEPHRTQLIGGVKHAYYFPIFRWISIIFLWFSNDPRYPSWLSEFWHPGWPATTRGCARSTRFLAAGSPRALRGDGGSVYVDTISCTGDGTLPMEPAPRIRWEEGSKWVWVWSCPLFISKVHAHRLYIYIIFYIIRFHCVHLVSGFGACFRGWWIEASTIVNAGAVATVAVVRSRVKFRWHCPHLPTCKTPPKTKVCFSGSILLETFDIEVVSYDGHWSKVSMDQWTLSWRLGTLTPDAFAWTTSKHGRLLRQGWHSEPQGLDWCSGWKLNGKTIITRYNILQLYTHQ